MRQAHEKETSVNNFRVLKRAAVLLILCFALQGITAQVQDGDSDANHIEIVQDTQGYRLLADGEPFEVKGVVWSYTPIGENYTYDLWSQPDEFIRRTIDTDAQLMRAAGVTTIRVFSLVPPRWITYLYRKYGIYTVVNDLFGRYGVSIGGTWYPQTDYSDSRVRKALKAEALKVVETYRDVPGVLMFLFGNENNYGLEWDSGQIADLPVGQQMAARARYLYTLYEEVISEARGIDPNHPMGLVNGDIQYIDLIQELVPSLQLLGVNVYRGTRSGVPFYRRISSLGIPFIYSEFGADAFNVRTGAEDQYHQAQLILSQWEELYEHSYGKDGYASALGGYVFEWMDEWWKHGQEYRLDSHDTAGSWSNNAYAFDAGTGRNNMNEEWFGIVAQGIGTSDGIHHRLPRSAYDLLAAIWELSLYDSTAAEVAAHFGAARGRSA